MAAPDLESVAGQIGALRRLFSFLPNPTAAAAGILSVTVVLALTPLIESSLLRRAIDALLGMNAPVFVTTLALQLSVALMLPCFHGWWRYARGVWSGQLATSLRKSLARHLLGLPFETAESYAPGELGSRVTSDVQRASALVDPLYRLTAVVVQAVVATVMMLVLDWRVGLATAVATPLVAWLSERLSRTIGSLAEAKQEGYAALSAFTTHSISSLVAVKVFGLEPEMYRRFASINESVLRRGVRLAGRMGLVEGMAWLGASLPLLVPVGYGGYLAFRGLISPGTLLTILHLSNYTRGPVADLGSQLAELRTAMGSARAILGLLQMEPGAERGRVRAPGTFRSGFSFNVIVTVTDLSFSYGSDGTRDGRRHLVLRNVFLQVPRGRVTFVMGPSGSGKSTLLKILGGLYDVSQGTVLVEGHDICDLRASGTLRAVYVPQDSWLFPWSLRENLALADPTADDEVLESALAASCAEFVKDLPEGLDTMVSEAGTSLSGGQKARLSVARALVARPDILLLDEPTAALDAVTEGQLISRLREAMTGKALIIVSHRLSHIQSADWVVVMDQGRVVEQGVHADLIVTSARYHALHRSAANTDKRGGMNSDGPPS